MWLSGLRTRRCLYEDAGSIPGLTQWVGSLEVSQDASVGRRCSSDPALLWLWHRLAAAAPVRRLAQVLPYAAGAALKRKKITQYRTLTVADRWCPVPSETIAAVCGGDAPLTA